MAAVWLRARAELRARWRAWLAMALLVGIAGGGSIAAAAGARRTDSAYGRFLESQRAADVIAAIYDQSFKPVPIERVRALPEVEQAGAVVGVFNSETVTPSGGLLVFPRVFSLVALDGGFGSAINGIKIIDGRALDPARADEVVVGFSVAEAHGIAVGDVLEFRLREMQPFFSGPPGPVAATERLRVVGIGAMPGEFDALAGASVTPIHLSPALAEKHPTLVQVQGEAFALRFERGAASLKAFQEAGAAAGLQIQPFFQLSSQTESVERSIGFQAAAQWMLAGLVALTALTILGQALRRQAQLEAEDAPVLRALGTTRRQFLAFGLVRASLIAVIGGAIAGVVAILASPLTPVGLARIAEPSPGFRADWSVIGTGWAAITLLVLGSSAVAFRGRRALSPADGSARGSRVAASLARAGAPAPVVAGVRLALETGRGRSAVPVRSTIIALALGLSGIATALTFGAGMHHLQQTPALGGWTFDLAIGGAPERADAYLAELKDAGVVDSFVESGVSTLRVNGGMVLDGVLAYPPGDYRPAIVDGIAPIAADEIALGRDTMAELGISIGGRVSVVSVVSLDEGERLSDEMEFRVVGRSIHPSLGFNLTTSSHGAALSVEGHRRLAASAGPLDRTYLVRQRPGTDIKVAVDSLLTRYPDIFPALRKQSSGAASAAQLGTAPALLGSILGLMALATLTHMLMSSIRRRRRDLAILRTLGFVRGQLGAAVLAQATCLVLLALALALPVGVIAGRWGWIAFADLLGVVPVARVPGALLAVVVPVTLAIALGIALLPARAAARVSPSLALRAD